MAFRFELDPVHRILRTEFSNSVTEDDLMYFYRMSALFVENIDPLSAITDFSAATSIECSAEFIRSLAALPPAMPKTERPRVVVAPMDQVFGLARIFAAEGAATRPNFHVVRSVQEALAIIGTQEPEFIAMPLALESRLARPGS